MNRLVLILMFLGALCGCSGEMVSQDEVRVREEDEVHSEDGPFYPELSCSEMEGEATVTADRDVSFENVSFRLHGEWVRDVDYFAIPECILGSDNFKPEGIGARTLQFNLQYNGSEDEGSVLVFKIEDYKKAFARDPRILGNVDAELRQIIANSSRLKSFGLDPPPHVRWIDAGQALYAKAAKIDFATGAGLLTVTYISQDSFVTISNSRLRFLYQGFTSDGKYFVEMDLPARLKGLPDEDEEFRPGVGSGEKGFNSPEHVVEYEKYRLKIAARIDKAPSTDFRPDLDQVKRLIRGFEIRTNE